jgi:hypothetical protein
MKRTTKTKSKSSKKKVVNIQEEHLAPANDILKWPKLKI